MGCGDPIEDNRRIALEVSVVDSLGMALQNIAINVAIEYSDGIVPFAPAPSLENIIGVGETNNQGKARIISLKPADYVDDIAVLVNTEDRFGNENANNVYNAVAILFDSIPDDEMFLPEIVLKNRSVLDFKAVNITGSEDTLRFRLEYKRGFRTFTILGEETTRPGTYTDQLTPRNPERQLDIETLEGTTATLFFERINNGIIDAQTVFISINEERTSYALEY